MGRYEDLAAFLVIARHANGRPPAGLAPHKFSGAGVNAVHEKAGLSEETARGAVLRLQAAGLIKPVSAEVKKVSYSARWEIAQEDLDLDLPHFLSDSADGINSALKRIRGLAVQEARSDKLLADVSDSELRLDVLAMLLSCYRHTSMSRFGGISPQCCYRAWEVKNQTPKSGGIRWGAEPELDHAFTTFMSECLRLPKDGRQKELSAEQKKRFWVAWSHLKSLGLIYEAVALFDVDPTKHDSAQIQCTLRVNDYHAGTLDGGDPSLLRVLEKHYGSAYAFYTSPGNDRGEPEAMWLVLPTKTGNLTGIWRLRFRVSNSDTGSWYEADMASADAYMQKIVNQDDQL